MNHNIFRNPSGSEVKISHKPAVRFYAVDEWITRAFDTPDKRDEFLKELVKDRVPYIVFSEAREHFVSSTKEKRQEQNQSSATTQTWEGYASAMLSETPAKSPDAPPAPSDTPPSAQS